MLNKEITLSDVFRILNRQKRVIFVAMGVVLVGAMLFNQLVPPKYESSVLLKKEKVSKEGVSSEIQELLYIRSLDEIETEIEIIKTRTVLEEVVKDLKLNFIIDKIEIPTQKTVNLKVPFIQYENEYRPENSGWTPHFADVTILPVKGKKRYFVEKTGTFTFAIYDAKGKKLLQSVAVNDSTPLVHFETPEVKFAFAWPKVKKGSKIYLTVIDFFEELELLKRAIKIKNRPKTELIEISVRAKSPQTAAIIANTIADVYRKNRWEQKQQTIRYSYNFIDEQLQDISKKLKKAEEELSLFKSQNKIIKMDDNSKNLVDFLSTLQAEKIKTDLELAEFENKLKQMKVELAQKGYFDQTYLTPGKKDESASPFSSLLRELSDLELKRLELLQRRKETHPDVVILNNQIKQIKEKLTKYNENTITAYTIIINSLKKKQRDFRRLIQNYTSRMQELPVYETRLAELLREKMVYEKIFTMLLDKREEMRIAELSKLQDIVLVDRAHVPLKPVFPRKKLNLAIGLFFGLIVGLILAVIIDFRNPRINDIEEVQEKYHYPLLAIIPPYSKTLKKTVDSAKSLEEKFVVLMDESVGFKEPYRVLKTKIMSLIEDFTLESLIPSQTSGKKIIMFTSCEEDSGKTTIVSNLGILFAQTGMKTLIIDCDLRKSKLGSYFNIPLHTSGLMQYLSQNSPHPEIYYPFAEWNNGARSLRNLGIIPAGGVTEQSSELLESARLESLFKIISDYDVILIDTPPITRIVDVLVLGKIIKNVVLIIKPNHTFKFAVDWAIEEITQNHMYIRGFVVNDCNIEKSSYRYKYGYGYGYSYKDKAGSKLPTDKKNT